MGTFDRLNKLNQQRETVTLDNPTNKIDHSTQPPVITQVKTNPPQKMSLPSPSPAMSKEETCRFTITVSKKQMKQVIQARAKLELEYGKSLTKSDVIRMALTAFISSTKS